jgi:putative acetyltransferase
VTIAPTVRAECPGDHDSIAGVVTAAFGTAGEARLVEAIRASTDFLPELALVAELEGQIVGHVMISHVMLEDGDVHRKIASLSPLAVAPDVQGRDIGSELVREVVARADDRGEALVVLEGSPGYYGRFGFEHSTPCGIHIELPAWAPPEAAQMIRLAGYDSTLVGRVVYPPAFHHVSEE